MGVTNMMKTVKRDQRGLVSFMVVAILMLVLTLIVMSYARIVQREQVQTLDRQLNTQALYAAESGVNDAVKALSVPGSRPQAWDKDKCDGSDSFMEKAGLSGEIDATNDISYSCILVDDTPAELAYPGVNKTSSTVIPLDAYEPAGHGGPEKTIDAIKLTWRSDDPDETNTGSCPGSDGDHPTGWAGCNVGMLRFELVTFNSGGTSRADLLGNLSVGFLAPGGAAESLNRASFSNNEIGSSRRVKCVNAECSLTINNVNMQKGYLRVRSIYRNTPLTVQAFSGGSNVPLVGAQVEVDVTGRASGVIKRVKVHRQLTETDNFPAPEFALQSRDSICKRFTYRPGAIGVVAPGGIADELCDPTKD